jgi:hypothetical protein
VKKKEPEILAVLKALNKRGRPRLDAAAAKSAIFPIRLSHEERAQITMAAQRDGLKDSEWARRVLLAAAGRP